MKEHYVDVENDLEMIQLGLRPPKLIINRRVFKKTDYEKTKLANCKKKTILQSAKIQPKSPFYGRLTIHLKNVKKNRNFRTTITLRDVNESDVSRTIAKYKNVNKYYFNRQYYKR